MKCEEVNVNLPEYIDRKLDETTSVAIRKHLESCPSCKALHSELSSFLNYMDSFPAPEVPEGMKKNLKEWWLRLEIRKRRKFALSPCGQRLQQWWCSRLVRIGWDFRLVHVKAKLFRTN